MNHPILALSNVCITLFPIKVVIRIIRTLQKAGPFNLEYSILPRRRLDRCILNTMINFQDQLLMLYASLATARVVPQSLLRFLEVVPNQVASFFYSFFFTKARNHKNQF